MNARLVRPCGVWLLCLGLVLPGVGRAAQEVPDTQQEVPDSSREVPGTQEDAPRRLLTDEQEEWEERTGAPQGLRILAEVGGGMVTGVGLGLAAGLTTGLLCAAISKPKDGWDGLACLALGALGFGAGAVVGVPLGVWWAGELLGGNGSLLAAFGGGALGLVGGLLLLGLTANSVSPGSGAASAIGLSVPALAMAGCVIGYELSQARPRRWATRGGLQPLLAFTPSAAVVGLSGHF